MRRRQFRIPVLSRLTMAWLGALSLVVIATAGFIYTLTSDEGPGRISLPIEKLETTARPLAATSPPDDHQDSMSQPGLKLASPDLREGGGADAKPHDADDHAALAYPEALADADAADDSDDANGEIVITIAGGGKQATAPIAASLRPAPIAVADPDPALLRPTAFGQAPRIGVNGRKAMNAYAAPYRDNTKQPEVAIIVGGLGLNQTLTERAIDELPPEISLAFAPYAKDLAFWTEKARKAGHETLIELPMEGYGGAPQSLGTAGLLTSRGADGNLQRLDWLLSRFGGYFAATNYMGAKFSADPDAIAPVLKKLRESGVAYFDDTGAVSPSSRAGVVAVSRVIPPAPEESGRGLVRRELDELERDAFRDGAAVGKTYAYGPTIDELAAWTKSLEDKKLAAAPASAVLRAKAATR